LGSALKEQALGKKEKEPKAKLRARHEGVLVITLFALPKAFRGHFELIQRNAITSWTRLSPKPEIILFGNEDGTADIARQLGLRHVPEVRRSEYGTPMVNDLFEKGQELATRGILCYVNSDILLLSDFVKAVKRVASWRNRFLMVGRRTNLDIEQLQDFDSAECEPRLQRLASEKGIPGKPAAIDYFVFTRGLYPSIPAFALGRTAWDNWLIWRARTSKTPVVDASAVITVIHQNHGYLDRPEGKDWVKLGEEAMRNRNIAGKEKRYSLANATHLLTPQGIQWNGNHLFLKKELALPSWALAPLAITLGVRRRLGLDRESLAKLADLLGRIGMTRV